jgi:hypothetical protein
VPADLHPEDSRKLALVMLQLHADFRRRHALPPMPDVWTLLEDLDALKRRAALTDAAVLRSPKAIVGPLVTGVRWVLWKLLKPVFDRQTDVNRDTLMVLERIARDREERRHAEFDLSVRVSELEKRRAETDRDS